MSIRIPLKKPKIKHYPITWGCILKIAKKKKGNKESKKIKLRLLGISGGEFSY